MFNHVSFIRDMSSLIPLMRAEYEKCNIWPEYEDKREFFNVLDEEIDEAKKNMDCMVDVTCIIGEKDFDESVNREVAQLRGYAMKTILECLHVLSVCNKRESQDASNDKN